MICICRITNIIPYIEELFGKFIKYEIATSIVWLVIAIIPILIGIWCFKTGKKINDGDDEYWCYLFGVALFIISFVTIVIQTFDIVTCFTLPEKILIEEFKEIYNNMN